METKQFLDKSGLFYMVNKIKGLLLGKADADLSNVSDATFLSKAQSIGAGGTPQVTSAGDGGGFTATVPGITAMKAGIAFVLIPHTTSTSTTPTLNVNELGHYGIRRRLSNVSTAPQPGYSNSWLAAGKPVLLIFDGTYWIVDSQARPASADLSGTVPIEKGGTGAETAAKALTNLGGMSKTGGTFEGVAKAGDSYQARDTYLLRNIKLSPEDETPAVDGAICFQYK